MENLDGYNFRRRREIELEYGLSNRRPNNIACPECGEELWDTSPRVTLTSDPPQKNVHCPDCGYHGFRIA